MTRARRSLPGTGSAPLIGDPNPTNIGRLASIRRSRGVRHGLLQGAHVATEPVGSLSAKSGSDLADLLSDAAAPGVLAEALQRQEAENLPLFGYGAKGFTLSVIETALDLAGDAVDGALLRAVVEIGRTLMAHPVELLPGAEDALELLSRTHRVVLVTKGDLVDQERKLERSGLRRHLAHVEIVSEESTGAYGELIDALRCPPGEFLMIGNSERSDVEPVLEIGG
ncbi:MAG TPA: HAD family hydrolase [Acidimicrobiales bacterium]|nr:HAD family hydrolase [Acidimicrobiales bacterium]